MEKAYLGGYGRVIYGAVEALSRRLGPLNKNKLT
jgi:hypothetical protein